MSNSTTPDTTTTTTMSVLDLETGSLSTCPHQTRFPHLLTEFTLHQGLINHHHKDDHPLYFQERKNHVELDYQPHNDYHV